MRRDHKPFALKRLLSLFEENWTRHFIRPQLDHLGDGGMIMKPWHLKLYGPNIRLGEAVHVVTSADRTVRLTTWQHEDGEGSIEVQDYALLCPGVRIDSATSVVIGQSTMLAAGVYITDADWHGIYNRPRPIGATAEVVLGRNVWIGDGAVVCKGVTVGDNTIVGAGAVVTKSLPANVVAAGNPAGVVKHLDTDREMISRADLLTEHSRLRQDVQLLDQALRKDNTWWGWLRTVIAPNKTD
ncbi:MAG: acyltransferase [Pseudomonadaceae bacterium]|nr:acyltransferase [Pseudomonadaceae bacterium]